MDESKVFVTDAELELTHGLDERSRLNVTDSTTKLDDADLGRFAAAIDGARSFPLDPVLNSIGQVRHDLDRLAEVVALSFLLNDLAIDLAGGDVVVTAEGDIEVSFVVTEVEIGLSSIVKNVDLTVLGGRHGTGIDVHVRIDLDGSNTKAEGLEKKTGGRGDNTLADTEMTPPLTTMYFMLLILNGMLDREGEM